MLDAGDIGEVKVANEHSVTVELLSHAVRLRNSSGGVDSIPLPRSFRHIR